MDKKIDIKLGTEKKQRVKIVIIFIVIIYSLILTRLFYLQVLKRDYYIKLSEENRVKIRSTEAPRGKIYDRNNKQIATNVVGYRLVYSRQEGYKFYKEQSYKEIAKLLEEDLDILKKRVARGRRYYEEIAGKNVRIGYEFQKIEADKLKKKLEELEKYPYLKLEFIPEKRVFFNLITKEEASYKLIYLRKKVYEDYEKKSLKIMSEITGESERIIKRQVRKRKKVNRYSDEIIISSNIEEKTAHKIMENLSNYPYLNVMIYPKRKYLYGKIASHVLGYVKGITKKELKNLEGLRYTQKDIIGKKGIEKKYDLSLKGMDGYEYIEVDALGKIVKKIKNKESEPGKDLYLTLDFELQEFMTDYFGGEKAAFLAMKADTGEILTIVSSPEYDLNRFSSKISAKEWNKILRNRNKPMQNRASVGAYPPGSIFKPIVALALLKNGLDPNAEIDDPGYYKVGKWTWRDWKWGGHGKVNLEKSLIESVNVYYYTKSHELGHEKLIELSKEMGVGRKTGIDIGEEKSGRIPDPEWKRKRLKEAWYPGDTINLSIGQGYLLVTPLQMLKAYGIIANEGLNYKPHLLKKTIDSKNKEEITKIEKDKEVALPKKHYKLIKNALRKVVTAPKGTASILDIENTEVAAKTGSAENPQYEKTHAWIAGYFPASKPEIIFVCFVEGGGHGGTGAGPAAKAFIEKYYELKGR